MKAEGVEAESGGSRGLALSVYNWTEGGQGVCPPPRPQHGSLCGPGQSAASLPHLQNDKACMLGSGEDRTR